MDDSQNIPLIGIEDFLKEVEEIQDLNKSYDENLDKIADIQGKLLQIGWNQKAREQESAELESLMSKNKGFQNAITKVRYLATVRAIQKSARSTQTKKKSFYEL